jgi:hypothetical protein
MPAAAANAESSEIEERTSLLVASISQTSKLLNKQPNLPPHLQISTNHSLHLSQKEL